MYELSPQRWSYSFSLIHPFLISANTQLGVFRRRCASNVKQIKCKQEVGLLLVVSCLTVGREQERDLTKCYRLLHQHNSHTKDVGLTSTSSVQLVPPSRVYWAELSLTSHVFARSVNMKFTGHTSSVLCLFYVRDFLNVLADSHHTRISFWSLSIRVISLAYELLPLLPWNHLSARTQGFPWLSSNLQTLKLRIFVDWPVVYSFQQAGKYVSSLQFLKSR